MAGTRLFLQASFIVQLLVIFVAAFYFGLSDDLVARHLFGSRDARTRLVSDSSVSHDRNKSIEFPDISFVCADSQVSFWSTYLNDFRQEFDHVKVKTHPELQSICRDPARPIVADADVWICESVPPPTETRMVISHSSTILYSRGLKHRKDDLQQLYPIMMSGANEQRQKDLRITLLVPTKQDIPVWTAALQTWLKTRHISDWACVGDVKVRARLYDVAKVVQEVSRGDDTLNVEEEGSSVAYQVSLANIASSLPDDSRTSDNTLHMSVFLPSRFPLVLTENGSRVVKRQNHIVTVIPEAVLENNHKELIDAALGPPLETFLGQSMGLPANLVDIVQFEPLDNTFPQWYTKLWYQRAISRRYKQVIELAEVQRQELIHAPSTVHVSDNVAASWLDAMDLVRQSKAHALRGLLADAVIDLDAAEAQLLLIRTDPSLTEPLDFPLEQYSAIFAPLLFPLMLPLLIGLRREYKRYKELKVKKDKKD